MRALDKFKTTLFIRHYLTSNRSVSGWKSEGVIQQSFALVLPQASGLLPPRFQAYSLEHTKEL